MTNKLTLDDLLKLAAHSISNFQQDYSWERDEKNLRECNGLDGILNKAESSDESLHLSSINRFGYIENFIPLLLIVRYLVRNKLMAVSDYLTLLQAVDCFIYRTYLVAGFDGDHRRDKLYGAAGFLLDRFASSRDDVPGTDYVHEVTRTIISKIHAYSYSLFKFKTLFLDRPFDWYNLKPFALKLTLFEYERWFREKEGLDPVTAWESLRLDRILTLSLTTSYWFDRWDRNDLLVWIDDIGNLLLTSNSDIDSDYPYPRKCRGEDENGNKMFDKCYANSGLMQEREMVKYKDWTVAEAKKRHDELVDFILKRRSFD